MQDLLTHTQRRCEKEADFDGIVMQILHQIYPEATISIEPIGDGQITLPDQTTFSVRALEHGLWEDVDHFEYLVKNKNHEDLVAHRTVRVIAAECEDMKHNPNLLVVGSKDFRVVFDDIDSWFVTMCAGMIIRGWQNRTLKDALAAKESFLRGITHQLRTPIHGILGSVELLAEELGRQNSVQGDIKAPTPKIQNNSENADPFPYIKTIRSSAMDLISTINSMIKLNQWAETARAERLVALHSFAEFETALLNGVAQALPDSADTTSSIFFNHRIPQYCNSLMIDLPLLVECIQPLVINALQSTRGGVVALSLSVSEDYQSLIIDVEDNGTGIEPANHERIFLAYEKIDTHTTGAGLGLTLACRLAAILDGSIALVSSKLGEGSHFQAVFQGPIYACSTQPLQDLDEPFRHLPPTFCRLPSEPTKTRTLSHLFGDYVKSHGCQESSDPAATLLILDGPSQSNELRDIAAQRDMNNVVLWLVSDPGPIIDFRSSVIRRENNILFIHGPIHSRTLKQALRKINLIFAEIAATNPVPNPLSEVNELEKVVSTSTPMSAADLVLDPLSKDAPVRIERISASLQTIRIHTPSPTLSASQVEKKKPRTLLVDDNAVNLKILQMYCKRRDIPYHSSTDGDQAVTTFRQQHTLSKATTTDIDQSLDRSDSEPIELILMDLQMPVCDGIQATKAIRSYEAQHALEPSVIFIVTGQDSSTDRADAEEAGANEYLVKPVGPKLLDKRIGKWFESILS
jgi:signal transduction histidine kinase/ActR/RegA family two-component response regulator